MSRETRIGILSVLVIAASIWGYKFIKGQNILSSQQFFYIEYDDVGTNATVKSCVTIGITSWNSYRYLQKTR